jgi:hypothetical protein
MSMPALQNLSAECSPQEMRGKIMALEAKMLELPQGEFPVKHHFSPGIYMRELFIPKGSTVTGKIHKTEHMNVLSQGDITVWTEDGMKRLTASTVIKSQPGIKRVGFAHEDSIWITVHHNPDNGQDIEKIEEMLVAKSFDEVPGAEPKQIQGEK